MNRKVMTEQDVHKAADRAKDSAGLRWGSLERAENALMAASDIIKALRAELAKPEVPECEWHDDEREPYWSTGCGEAYQFFDGGPKENNMGFCCYCGHKIKAAPQSTADEEHF